MGLSNASEYVQGLYGDVTNILRGTLLMQPTIKAYDNSTWVLDNLVGIANNFNYDSYGYGVYYDTVHGDISASNPLLVNNLLKRNTRVDRFVGTASADVDLLKMIGIDSKTTSSTIKSISLTAKPIARTSPGFLHGYRATVSIWPKATNVSPKLPALMPML